MSSTSSTSPNGSAPCKAVTSNRYWRYSHERNNRLVNHLGTDAAERCDGVCHPPHFLGPKGARPRCRVRQLVCKRYAAASHVRRPLRERSLLRDGSDGRAARVREHGGARQIPPSWRGDRMKEAMEI